MEMNLPLIQRCPIAIPPQATSIISHLLRAPYRTELERCADVTLLLLAGFDTSANSVSWTLIEIYRNPPVLDRIRVRPASDSCRPMLAEERTR